LRRGKDVADHRESPAFDILDGLRRLGATVEYVDRRVPEVEEHRVALRSVSTAVDYGRYDAVVIVTDHSDVDYARMLGEAKIGSTPATCSATWRGTRARSSACDGSTRSTRADEP
jgi:UDP-N-acetyl-D-mannosaminuronate dehydrogenase